MKYSKTLSRVFLVTLCALTLSMSTAAFAQDLQEPAENVAMTAGETTITPRGEVTGYKYTTINGVKYKRLWSYTNNCWIDDAWIPC